jgi:hypothetical protein
VKILQAVEDYKAMVLQRQTLVDEKKSVVRRIKKGCDFFEQIDARTSREDINQGAALMRKYLNENAELEKKIFELDIAIGARLESEFLDSIVEIRTKKIRNEAGDTIPNGNFLFMPSGYNEEDYLTIDERDIWFLKVIKAAFPVQNIEVMRRGDIE